VYHPENVARGEDSIEIGEPVARGLACAGPFIAAGQENVLVNGMSLSTRMSHRLISCAMLAFGSAFSGAACSPRGSEPSVNVDGARFTASNTATTVQRGWSVAIECRSIGGDGPSYDLRIADSGALEYEGIAGVVVTGHESIVLSADAMTAIRSALQRSKLDAMKDSYGGVRSHATTFDILWTDGGVAHRTHYQWPGTTSSFHGDGADLAALQALDGLVMEILASSGAFGWIGTLR